MASTIGRKGIGDLVKYSINTVMCLVLFTCVFKQLRETAARDNTTCPVERSPPHPPKKTWNLPVLKCLHIH